MNTKRLQLIHWIARGLGILLAVGLTALATYQFVVIIPGTLEKMIYFFWVGVPILLAVIFNLFLQVAWRKEGTGGKLYLAFFGVMLALIFIADQVGFHGPDYGYLYLAVLPVALTGVMFLISGRMVRSQ